MEDRGDGHVYPTRSGDAVMQRFRKSRSESLKLEGIIASIKARNPTGSPTNIDIERAAVAIYNGEGTYGTMYTYLRSSTMDVGPEFQYMEAFRYLWSTHTWDMVRESHSSSTAPRKAASPSYASVDVGTDIFGAMPVMSENNPVVAGTQSVSSSQEPVSTSEREDK